MKNVLFLIIGILFFTGSCFSQVAINNTGAEADASAMLDIGSTDKGILAPRMTTAQRTAIASPANGLLVYDTETKSFWHYNNDDSLWVEVVSGTIGLNDLSDSKADWNSVFIGENSGINNNGGTYSSALGYGSLRDLTTGIQNTAIGYIALLRTETGERNTAIGYRAMVNNLTGGSNIAIGIAAYAGDTDGDSSTFVGTKSGFTIDGDKNCGYGYGSLAYIDGDRNTAIGSLAGYGDDSFGSSTSFNDCVFLGYEAGKNNTNDNKLYIENSDSDTPLIGGDFSTNQVDINGTIKITGGTPGNGKVLTSDADGLASWEDNLGATELNDLSDAITDGNSVFIGTNSGVSNSGTDNMNTSVGYEAVRDVTTGDYNTVLGYNGLKENTTGSRNTTIGSHSMINTETGSGNIAVGFCAMYSNISGWGNVAIGENSNRGDPDGNGNTYIGTESGAYSSGDDNCGVGYLNMPNNIGDRNTSIGKYAGYDYYDGMESSEYSGCIFIGYAAGSQNNSDNKLYIENSRSESPLIGGDFSTNQVDINGTIKITGGTPGNGKVLTSDADGLASWEENLGATELNDLSDAITDGNSVFIGDGSGDNDDGNNSNTAVGFQTLNLCTSGLNNAAFGYQALAFLTEGRNNTAFGFRSLYDNTTGINNTAYGRGTLANNTDGADNVALGYQTLVYNATGTNNTAVGSSAGFSADGVNFNGCVFLGYSAGYQNTSDNKLYIENSDSETPLIGGDFSTNQVDINGTIKITGGTPGNGKVLTSDADGLASWEPTSGATELNDLSDAITDGTSVYIGTSSGVSNSGTSNNNTSVGYEALRDVTTGEFNTALGSFSLCKSDTGIMNTVAGSFSATHTNGDYNTILGAYNFYENTSGSGNIAIGTHVLWRNTTGNNNTSIGRWSLHNTSTGNENTALGYEAGFGFVATTFSGCVFLGSHAGYNNTSDNKLYIDNSTTSFPLIGGDFSTDQVDINGTLKITGGTPGEGKVLTSDADGLSSWQTASVSDINSLSDAIYNGSDLFLGNGAGESNSGSNNSVVVGRNALNSNTTSDFNTVVGNVALENNTGERNTVIGYSGMHANTTGFRNTSIGYSAGLENLTGSYNTFLGYRARVNTTTAKVNSTAVGSNAVITASNQVKIGDSYVSSIGGVVAWSVLSDGRFKENVKEDVAGLDFIINLRPVSYTVNKQAVKDFVGSDSRSSDTSPTTRECGFVAQEVEKLVKTMDVEFNGVDAPENAEDYYGIRYSQFVVPLVKSVQELNEKLEKENAELKARIEKLEEILLKK